MTGPIPFVWDGEAMVPAERFRKHCDKEFVVGLEYPLVIHESRSRASHNHFFASIEEAWLNLPEHLQEHFPSSEHLRKYALIKSGYADNRSIVCASKAEAQRLACFIKPMDAYAIVSAHEATVTVWTAQSQSHKAMGKAVFQKSKDDVLDIIAGLVGVKPQTLAQEAGQAA